MKKNVQFAVFPDELATLTKKYGMSPHNVIDILAPAPLSLPERQPRSVKYIGALLGFRDQSSFHKACRRWFGMTPGRYRQEG